ncbi:hypothetical protein CLOM_g20672 [Closterium sp. NIES-68]|nr:hypothetical protein CLOM_g20672 [Closterium sp. NIES-68]GJP76606.1 hypothetical protein CLOP_g7025 [Closterium sp. NIES-67]
MGGATQTTSLNSENHESTIPEASESGYNEHVRHHGGNSGDPETAPILPSTAPVLGVPLLSAPVPGEYVHPGGASPWQTGLFGCCDNNGFESGSDCKICCLGFFCSPCLFGTNREMLTGDESECCRCCCSFYLIGVAAELAAIQGYPLAFVTYLFPLFTSQTRAEIRRTYGIQSEAHCMCRDPSPLSERVCDCCIHAWCLGCALCQESRELMRRPTAGRGRFLQMKPTVAPLTQTMHP